MSFSDYLEAAILNAIFGKASDLGTLSAAPTIYVALFTSAPAETGTGTATECDYGAYARVQTASTDWTSATGGAIENANAITFPEATSGNNTATHFALVDAPLYGNILAYGQLQSSVTISQNITPEFAIGDLNITLD